MEDAEENKSRWTNNSRVGGHCESKSKQAAEGQESGIFRSHCRLLTQNSQNPASRRRAMRQRIRTVEPSTRLGQQMGVFSEISIRRRHRVLVGTESNWRRNEVDHQRFNQDNFVALKSLEEPVVDLDLRLALYGMLSSGVWPIQELEPTVFIHFEKVKLITSPYLYLKPGRLT